MSGKMSLSSCARLFAGALSVVVASAVAENATGTVVVTPVDPATVWNRQELYRTPKMWKNQDPFTGEVTPIWIEGVPYRGRPTRAFAFLGIPEGASATNKVPGIVLIHGGLGTAYPEWVRLWTKRGYAAIAVDNCGQIPAMGLDGKWMANPDGGPRGWGRYEAVDEPPQDQWMYHAVALSVLSHSYLRSLACVDTANVGVSGISWGGVLTCIVAALDERFAYAVPVYGCGFNHEKDGIAGGHARSEKWGRLWDPAVYLPYVRIPFLWVDGTNDLAFSLDRVMRSAALAPCESQFCTRLRMPHAHGAPGEAPAEILAFAEHYARGKRDIVRVHSAEVKNGRLAARFAANGRRIVRAELLWTEDGCDVARAKRLWRSKSVDGFDPSSGEVSVALPEKTAQAVVNLIDAEGLISSTRTIKTW